MGQLYLNKYWIEPKMVNEEEVSSIFNKKNRFKSEKEMAKYIEQNIEKFCSGILDDKYVSHKRETRINKGLSGAVKGYPNLRLDLLIQCKRGKYAIELKNPTNIYSEMSRSISQVMLYDMILEKLGEKIEVVIVSSVHSKIYIEMLNHYNLKYRYFLLNKDSAAELRGFSDVKE